MGTGYVRNDSGNNIADGNGFQKIGLLHRL